MEPQPFRFDMGYGWIGSFVGAVILLSLIEANRKRPLPWWVWFGVLGGLSAAWAVVMVKE